MFAVDVAAIAWGFVYAIAAGQWLTGSVVTASWSRARRWTLSEALRFLTPMVGTVESAIYVGAVIARVPEVIAAWLVLKSVVVWKPLTTRPDGRNLYNVFLVGNGMSVVCGVAGGASALLWSDGKHVEWALVLVAPVFLAAILLFEVTDASEGIRARLWQVVCHLEPSWWDAARHWF